MGCRIEGAGCRWSARRVSDAASVRGIVRKHDCALPTLHPKHSNTQGALIRVKVRVRARDRARVIIRVKKWPASSAFNSTYFSQEENSIITASRSASTAIRVRVRRFCRVRLRARATLRARVSTIYIYSILHSQHFNWG